LLPTFVVSRFAWDSEVFKTCRNRKLETAARVAIHCEKFYLRFLIIYDIMQSTGKLRTWAAGCLCHEAERLRGVEVACRWQGKRLPEASGRVAMFLQYCKRVIDRPQPDQETADYAIGSGMEEERSFAWRNLASMTEANLSYVDRQPYFLATVTCTAEHGIERDIWRSLPEPKKHRYTSQLFSCDPGH
jgi:hypothetical protein